MKKFLFILFVIASISSAYAQHLYKLNIKETSSNADLSKLSYKKEFTDSIERKKELQNYLYQLYDKGYLAATFDSIKKIDSISIVGYINTGKAYKFVLASKGNVDEILIDQFIGRKIFYDKKPVNYTKLIELNKNIIEYYENNGYPFASIKLDSIKINSDTISTSLNLKKNKKCLIDSIIIKGDAKITVTYLSNYLGIKQGAIYNEQQIKKISSRLKEISFLKEIKPYNVIFSPKYTKLALYLQKNKSSQFDGIVGLKQNDKNPNKYDLTGQLYLKLINSFGRGELVDLNWQSVQPLTQDLKMNFVYPYIFITPLGFDVKFAIYKKDSIYINLNENIGLQYLFTGRDYIKVFLDNKKSSLISTYGMESTTVLPSFADVSSSIYGLEFFREHLDFRYNPRRGHLIKITVGAGTKTIKKNNSVNPIVYENLKLNSSQYNLQSQFDFYFPIKKRSVIKLGSQSAWIINDNLFQNELFRIGGLKTLRGFDEESIYASKFSILATEYRFLFEQKSYLFTFINAAYYENYSINKQIHDTPFGFGAGISFETKAGIFSISYGLGKQFNNPINFRSAKISFGIINNF